MKDSIRLGRIAGIEVGINWSWLIVLVLMLWTLAAGIFPAENPDLSDGTYAAMAVVAAVVFFASLFLHEMGHALTARRFGMQIDGITLWMFGGVAKFRGMFPSAAAEFRIAIAGPLVSVALGGLFVGLAWIVQPGRAVDGVLSWLGYINLVLAGFNMLPAQPLDGGRVLHSVLWRTSGDLVTATRRAARAGEILGYVMIFAGVFAFITMGAFGGAWLAFLGWFLLTAARLEARAVLVRQALAELRVRDLMTPHPVTVSPDVSLGRFMDEVAWRTRFTSYPVVDDAGVVSGLLAFRDVAAAPREEWDRLRVADALVDLDAVTTVAPGDLAVDAFDRVVVSPLNRALVVDAGRLVGLLSITDMMRAIEAGGMRIHSRPQIGPHSE
jgi:Zn-dependent protease/predicted transcriptional regulator